MPSKPSKPSKHKKQNMIKLTKDNFVDLLITHVEIKDRKAIRCDNEFQFPQDQFAKHKNRPIRPDDQITAYVFGRTTKEDEGSYCVEVPYNPTCYLRVPLHWEKLTNMIPDILEHILVAMIGSQEHAKPYMGCLKAKFVKRFHAFGYRPEPHYLFLKIDCSNRFIYKKLKSYFSSFNTKRRRSKWHDKFYARFLTLGFLGRTNISNPDEIQDLTRHTKHLWYTSEWFVAHEFLDDTIAFLKSIALDINGFVRVSSGMLNKHPVRGFSNAGNEIMCTTSTAIRGVDLETIPKGTLAPVMKMTFDIECAPKNVASHPNPYHAYDKVTQIGAKTAPITDKDNADKLVFTLGNPAPSENYTYKKYKHETELLAGFAKYIVEKDIDLFTTFNGMGFDWDYMHKRACLALFSQTNVSFVVAKARWEHLHEQYNAYMPLQKAYTALTTKYKKKEEQDTPQFKHKEQELFKKMARVLDRQVTKNIFRQPLQDPYKQAIWAVSNVHELERIYNSFRAQPSIMPWFFMHRMRCEKIGFDIRPKSSAALGNQLLKTPNDGRTNSDVFLYIKTSYAMDKYGLNDCAAKFLKNESKDDLLEHYKQYKTKLSIKLQNPSSIGDAYHMMYEYIASERPELLKPVCEYCYQDVEVTDQLDVKLGIPYELGSMMKRYRVILQALTRRAQQYRFMTNVSFEIMDKFVFNSYDRTAKAPTYQGAAVLPPKYGLHGAPWEWVFCLDFASLYPTLMRERNFCIRSFILPCDRARILQLVKEGKHPPLMAVPYARPYVKGRDPVIVIDKDNTDIDLTCTALFAIMKKEETILPKFLERMGNDRGAVKKDMKKNYATQSALKTIQKASKSKDWTTKEEYAKTLETKKHKLETKLKGLKSSKKRAKVEKEIKSIDGILSIIFDIRLGEIDGELVVLEFKYMVLDSEQKAIKIGMNSVYGSLGVKEGTITGLQEIAMSITYCGRMYIFKTRDFCYDYAATTPGWEDLELEIVYGVRGSNYALFVCVYYTLSMVYVRTPIPSSRKSATNTRSILISRNCGPRLLRWRMWLRRRCTILPTSPTLSGRRLMCWSSNMGRVRLHGFMKSTKTQVKRLESRNGTVYICLFFCTICTYFILNVGIYL